MPRANTKAMQGHLNEIAGAVSPGAHAVVLLDQAGWHTTLKLSVPGNITLPPRSPELNPAENLWQFLRHSPTGCSRATTPFSMLPAMPGTPSSRPPHASCLSVSGAGHAQVSVKGDWY
jgi:hypothetical protein